MECSVDLYCRRCRRAVNVLTRGGNTVHIHGAAGRMRFDHEPDPVPIGEIQDPIIECDFCSGDPCMWTYLTEHLVTEYRQRTASYVSRTEYVERGPAARSYRDERRKVMDSHLDSAWAACATCAELVEARDIPRLVTRVAEALPAKVTRGSRMLEVRGQLYQVYEQLLPTIVERTPIAQID